MFKPSETDSDACRTNSTTARFKVRTRQESIITVEHAGTRLIRKPWGCTALQPWCVMDHDSEAISTTTPVPALLLKFLFVDETLSIQEQIGLPNGKPARDAAAGLPRSLTTKLSLSADRAVIETGGGLTSVAPMPRADFLYPKQSMEA